jgi:hypothetical protein
MHGRLATPCCGEARLAGMVSVPHGPLIAFDASWASQCIAGPLLMLSRRLGAARDEGES